MALYFLCPISDQLVSPFLSRCLIQSVTLLNLVPRSHSCVLSEINFLSPSFERPTIEHFLGFMGSSMVGLSNERDKKLISVCTSDS